MYVFLLNDRIENVRNNLARDAVPVFFSIDWFAWWNNWHRMFPHAS
jgi:hypothetical protein